MLHVASLFPSKRNSLMIELAYRTGARASELLNIRKIDLLEDSKQVLIRGVKGSKDREVPIPDDLFSRLEAFALDLGPEDRLFPIAYNTLGAIWRREFRVKKKFHSLRHTFAIHALNKTNNVRLVQRLLGHKSITNTEIYLDYVYDLEAKRKIL